MKKLIQISANIKFTIGMYFMAFTVFWLLYLLYANVQQVAVAVIWGIMVYSIYAGLIHYLLLCPWTLWKRLVLHGTLLIGGLVAVCTLLPIPLPQSFIQWLQCIGIGLIVYLAFAAGWVMYYWGEGRMTKKNQQDTPE